MITLRNVKGTALTHDELDGNFEDLSLRTQEGWKDMLAPLTVARVPVANAPVLTNFTVGGITRREYAFAVNDYLYVQPFHTNHDIKPNGLGYLHIHWTTSGTSTASVRWKLDILRAKGHNQEAFTAVDPVFLEQAASGVAYQHMLAEAADVDALIFTEPDELILVTVTRVTNGGTNNTDAVFGLMCDIHYEADRDTTPNKAPNFYS
jgi:hypothetical protein